MTVSSVTGSPFFTASYAEALSRLKSNLDSLSNQLATGQKATTYAGLDATDRATALAVQGQLNALGSYTQAAGAVNLRLQAIQTTIDGLNQVASSAKSSFDPNTYNLVGGQTAAQTMASTDLGSAIDMLNVNVTGHYLFGGREVSQSPVAPAATIMNGSGGLAGFNQVVAERRAADLGSGQLTVSQPTATSVAVGGSVVASAVATSIAGAAVSVDPAGAPATIDLTQQPVDGDTVSLQLTGPDGTPVNVQLTATTTSPPGAGQFAIGATLADTAANLDGAIAQLGTGVGRLTVTSPAAGSVEVASTDPSGPFGFKIAAGAASTSIAGATVTVDPAASSATIALTQQPVAGDTVSLALSLPDGTTSNIQLTATTASPPGTGQFTIGASPAETAANLGVALTGAITTSANTDLVAASAMAAANDFFSSRPPQRVDIPPGGSAATATGLRDGSADTVAWYQGEDDGSSPRATQAAQIGAGLTVAYGARADEDGPRGIISALAVMSAVSFADAGAAGTNGSVRNSALVQRVNGMLGGSGDLGPVGKLATDMAAVEQTVKDTQSRNQTTQSTLQGMLADAQNADPNAVAVALLQAQTQLQASYQTTAILSKLSLVNFLS